MLKLLILKVFLGLNVDKFRNFEIELCFNSFILFFLEYYIGIYWLV